MGRGAAGGAGRERFETVIIGGGQAGLSVGYHLAKRDRPFVILDANGRIGDSWRKAWDSLGRVVGVRDGQPLLEGDRLLDVANVIWCTGFHPDFSWIHLPVFERPETPSTFEESCRTSPGCTSLVCCSSMPRCRMCSPASGGTQSTSRSTSRRGNR
jgi:putative NAD(P)-binding protein